MVFTQVGIPMIVKWDFVPVDIGVRNHTKFAHWETHAHL